MASSMAGFEAALLGGSLGHLSRPGIETVTRACQQIRHPYGNPRIAEASNLQKVATNNYTDIRIENNCCNKNSNYCTTEIKVQYPSPKNNNTIIWSTESSTKRILLYNIYESKKGDTMGYGIQRSKIGKKPPKGGV